MRPIVRTALTLLVVRVRIVRVLALSLSLAACTMGGDVSEHPTALSPKGVHVDLGSPDLTGELLAVERDALLVRTPGDELLRIPFGAVKYAELADDTRIKLPPDADGRERLRLLSRYPQGVSSDLLARLLTAYGRDSVAVVGGGVAGSGGR